MPLDSKSPGSRDPRRRATTSSAAKPSTTQPSSSVSGGGGGPKKKSGRGILIVIIVLLLAGHGVLYWFLSKEQKTVEEKNAEIEVLAAEKDSIEAEYVSLDSLYTEKLNELRELEMDTTRLFEEITKVRKALKSMRSSRNYYAGQVKGWKTKFEELQSESKMFIDSLKTQIQIVSAERDSLFNTNQELKERIQSREDSINAIAAEKDKLNQKVEVASVLQARSLQISYLDKRDNERDDEDDRFKGRKVVKIKVAIDLLKNAVAKVESKDVYLRIVQPSGSTLSDLSMGGGTFEASDGSEKIYTARQDFLFDNQNNPAPFVYEQGEDWEDGDYRVEVYIDGHLAGEKTFSIR